jgi:hypothetical protein
MIDFSMGSSSSREDVYIELYKNNIQWGEIVYIKESDSVNINIFSTNLVELNFECDEFINVINKAKNKLLDFYK